MSNKIRKQIYIEPRQDNLIKATAKQIGVSEAEIIRQAIDLHISLIKVPQINLSHWEAEKAFIDTIKQRPALGGGRDWQREDLYER